MQNEPNFKPSQIAVTLFLKANCLKLTANSWQKNEPKRSQLTRSVTPDLIRGPESSSLFSLRTLRQNKKMTNKPNFLICKNMLTPYFIRSNDSILMPGESENKAKQTQFYVAIQDRVWYFSGD